MRRLIERCATGTSSFTRNGQTVGSPVTNPQRLTVNSGRNGYTRRTAESVVDSAGAIVNVREFYATGLRGMGIAPAYLPSNSTNGVSNASFILSINQ